VAKIKHLIEHCITEPFNLRNAIAHFADDPHILLAGANFCFRDLRFNFL
jgi:hypothetical protein